MLPVAAPTTPSTVEGVCPSEEWEEFGGYCYIYAGMNKRLRFPDAEVDCGNMAGYFEGHLPSIHNKVVNQWLLEFVQPLGTDTDIWLGLTKDDHGRLFLLFYSFKPSQTLSPSSL